jgi:uncharacterized protein
MNKIIEDNLSKIETLCKEHKVESLYLFGSAARDDSFSPQSDVDLLVSFNPELTKGYATNYFTMSSELEKLFKRHVDLVEQESLSNPYLIKSVNQTKVLLYGR